jgi:cell division protein FtsW (lipid II flippase)
MPLVSMGGTSTLFTSIAIGMILGVSTAVYSPEELNSNKASKTSGGNVYAEA